MSLRIYVDTNVYLDLLLGRSSRYRDFAFEANRLFHRAKSCEFEIVVSDWVLEEISCYVGDCEISSLLDFLDFKAIRVMTSDVDRAVARSFTMHYADALHLAVALRNGADVFVTRNIKDFVSAPMSLALPESL